MTPETLHSIVALAISHLPPAAVAATWAFLGRLCPDCGSETVIRSSWYDARGRRRAWRVCPSCGWKGSRFVRTQAPR
jgi:predicted RNA-binding Zn-ribbon protein involved in translation (DUF1610 family)